MLVHTVRVLALGLVLALTAAASADDKKEEKKVELKVGVMFRGPPVAVDS